jgi:two-component system chemotaxis sensor kinase CheA
LILDLRGLLRIARLPPVEREPEAVAIPAAEITDRYLVCGTLGGRRVAVPLADVVRLETFHRDDVQVVGHRRVVRRGDVFTTLQDADELLGSVSAAAPATVNVVVIAGVQGGFGLTVGSIIDVLAAESRLQPAVSPGVSGILALGGVATEIIDLDTAMGDAR